MWYKKLVYCWTLRNNNNMEKKMFRIEKYIKGKAKYLHNVECRWCGGIAFSIMYYNLGVFFFVVGWVVSSFKRWF